MVRSMEEIGLVIRKYCSHDYDCTTILVTSVQKKSITLLILYFSKKYHMFQEVEKRTQLLALYF